MSATVDFYFDFMSPFAYLARHRLVQIARDVDCKVNYKPIDLPRAKLAIGNNGPANRDLPVKLRYLIADLKRWADIYRIPLGYIGNVNTAQLNKGVFYAIQCGCAEAYVREAYQMTWAESGVPDDPCLLEDLAKRLGWSPNDFASFLESPEAADAYEATNAEAIARGVFGVPTVMIDDQMWWGNDRLFMVEEYLRQANHGAAGSLRTGTSGQRKEGENHAKRC